MRILSALVAFATLLTGCTTASPPPPRPALWEVSDEDTRIWLFGTIHVLPKDFAWRGPWLDRAISGSGKLVIEAVMDRDPAKAAGVLAGLGRADGLPPLAERVPADRREALAAMVAKTGLPAHGLDGFKTWAAALVLMGSTIRGFQLSAADGVEPLLEAEFAKAGKPIAGLETAEQQLGYFDGLSEEEQRKMLLTLLEPDADQREQFDAMVKAWSRGRDAEIATAFEEEMNTTPAVREALVDRRNAAWADQIARWMDEPGETLVAVGAGHLAGPTAVQKLLEAKGLTVKRVQ